MREIKFRVFENGRMDYDPMNGTFGSLNQNFKHPDIMQYTGLKDKNGTEIYEGDIIHLDVSDISHLKPVEYEVFWNNDTALHYGWALKNIITKGIMPLDLGIMTVIGNIYEAGD